MTNKYSRKQFIFNWEKQQILFLGLVLGVSSILSIFYIDQPLTKWFHETVDGRLDFIARIFTALGSGDIYFFISVCGYLLARLFSQKLTHLNWSQRFSQTRHRFGFMFLSFFISGIMVLLLKFIFGRARPYHSSGFEPLQFHPFTLDWDFQSYPSGHTQVGFTLATFLSLLYPKQAKYFFLFATLVGFSRVILEKHYLGDVLAGAYIGISGTYLTWLWKGHQTE